MKADKNLLKRLAEKQAREFDQKDLKLKYIETKRLLEKYINTFPPSFASEYVDRSNVNITFHKKTQELIDAWNNDLDDIQAKSQKLEEKVMTLKPTEFNDDTSLNLLQKLGSHFTKSNRTMSKKHEDEFENLKDVFEAEAKNMQQNYYQLLDDKPRESRCIQNCTKRTK